MTSRRRMMAGANLTSKGVVDGVIQDDWDQIIKICKSGKADQFYSIGDKKLLDLGELGLTEMAIANFNVDMRADNKGFAPTSWICLNPLRGGKFKFTRDLRWDNSTSTYDSEVYWDISPQKAYAATVLDAISENIRSQILEVKKNALVFQAQGDNLKESFLDIHASINHQSWIIQFKDKIWIPSAHEMVALEEYGGLYPEFFKLPFPITFYGEDEPVVFSVRDRGGKSDVSGYSAVPYYGIKVKNKSLGCADYNGVNSLYKLATNESATNAYFLFGFCL